MPPDEPVGSSGAVETTANAARPQNRMLSIRSKKKASGNNLCEAFALALIDNSDQKALANGSW